MAASTCPDDPRLSEFLNLCLLYGDFNRPVFLKAIRHSFLDSASPAELESLRRAVLWRAFNPDHCLYCLIPGHGVNSISMNSERLKRITIEEGKCGGRPCIRGLRIRVSDVLELLAAGASHEEILRDYPYLENDDILAALEFAAHQADHSVLKA